MIPISQRALYHPQNTENIVSFLTPNQQGQFLSSCRVLSYYSRMVKSKERHPSLFLSYRYPFSFVCFLEKAQELFQIVKCNPVYLREARPDTQETAAWFAFRERRFELCVWMIEKGGLFNTSESQTQQLIAMPQLFTEYPAIANRIRQVKWQGATTLQQKQTLLQNLLEKYCLIGHTEGIRWTLHKFCKNKLPFYPFKPLQFVTLGGFEDIFSELCINGLHAKFVGHEKMDLISTTVEMGYPKLLSVLKQHGFPIKKEHKRQLDKLKFIQRVFARCVFFPLPASFCAHFAHGGPDNSTTAKQEYVHLVAYAFNALRKGMNIQRLIENIMHRRRRMAALGKLIGIENYGKRTQSQFVTIFDPSYKSYGEHIQKKYKSWPVQVKKTIKGREIPLTKIEFDRWIHPDGKHYNEVMGEIVRICEPMATQMQKDLVTPLSELIWLFSHHPLCERGTPIVLRALVDAFCLFQHREPIDRFFEINCEALVHDNQKEFTELLRSKFPLPISNRQRPVYSLNGVLNLTAEHAENTEKD